jgi:flagellar motor protein MotB/Asp-tRNA(Asn)/Glu-tRNA(Gln) amidotransferase C subunit
VPVSIAVGDSDSQSQDELSVARNHLQLAKQKIEELERQLKQRIGELVLQLHAKDNEIAALITSAHQNSKQLREDLASRSEELTQAKRRVAEVEQQMATTGKGQELAQAKRRVIEVEQQAARKEQELAQARRRITEMEQQLAASGNEHESAQAKRRGSEIEQLMAGKEQELAQFKRRVAEIEQQMAWKEQDLAHTKRRAAEADQQTEGKDQELAQARRRVAEAEQQMAGKEQELAHAKRRAAEADQQTAGKEQELAQAKRRITEAEQQTTKKEQELAQVKEDLKQITQKVTDLTPQLAAKEAELTRTKQLLTELELYSSKQPAPTSAQEETPLSLSLLSIDHNLSLTDPFGSDSDATDNGEAVTSTGDIGKIGENLASLLQPELKKGSAALRQRGNRLTLALATGELFSPGDATVTLGGTSLLERVAVALHGFRYQSVEIAGHTDNQPVQSDPRRGFRNNNELSRARADHALQVLVNGGLEADRVKAVGYADSKPIATNDTEKGRSKNRRMEIVITRWPEPGGNVADAKTPVEKKLQDSSVTR